MNQAEIVARIRQLVASRRYRITLHAEREREADQITVEELKQALLGSDAELLEDYPDDPRGPSCLLLGFTEAGLPVHVVCRISAEGEVVMITMYRPNPDVWTDWRVRKR